MTYEKSQKTYQQESDTWSSESYEKPAKKTYSEPAIQLSRKQIQRALKSAGFYQGPIDGKIGSKTKEAIIKFRKQMVLRLMESLGKGHQRH